MLTVILDALHAGHVHHLGYERETTPNIDALAAEGVSFTRASAPAPYTVASAASLMTGLLPQRHGILQRFGSHIRPSGTTLAEQLSRAGWQCFGATANSNAGERTGITAGFHEWIEAYLGPGQAGEMTLDDREGNSIHFVSPEWWPGHLEDILQRRDPERDTFIYLHLLQPHSPYLPPQEYLDRFADPEYESSWSEEGIPRGYAAGETGPLMRANDGQLPMTAADRRHTIAMYDATLLWADAAVGGMVEVLRAAEVWDSTWMIVTSDHGEAFWQHGRWGHNDHLYEEMLRVPLVVRAPADYWPEGERNGRLVSPMDILPTVLEWAELPPVEGLDGRSLGQTLSAEGPDDRRLVLQSNGDTPITGATGSCVKLIVGPDSKGVPEVQQFHLPTDPGERDNQAGPAPPTALEGAVADRTSETFRPGVRVRAARSGRGALARPVEVA